MHVLFVDPSFPANQRRFVHALAGVGARVTGIGELPAEHLDDDVRGALHGYQQVGNVTDPGALERAVRRCQQRAWVDRLEAVVEAHVLAAARVREACTIPGTSVRTAWLCRDKPAMKDALRAAGVPCARSAAVDSAGAARDFARSVGYPIILKPRDGAGAAGTDRIDTDAALEAATARHGLDRGASVAAEEFNVGHEFFYDAITIDGRVVMEFFSHYEPGVLEAMRTRWISPVWFTTNRLESPLYDEVRAMARRVIETVGIGTSAVHSEWFFGPKGLRFSEIGCRPPGVGAWDVYCAANDLDLYRQWAHAIVHGSLEQAPSRRFAGGMVALRPERDGIISHLEGLEAIQQEFGEWIIDAHVPAPGTPTQPVDAGYMANAWMRLRHPDEAHLRWMLARIGERARLRVR